jgi:hypothetical protein
MSLGEGAKTKSSRSLTFCDELDGSLGFALLKASQKLPSRKGASGVILALRFQQQPPQLEKWHHFFDDCC